ncbi:glycosyltransferase [Promicromonospora sp. NPDC023805]|uniref:glycosyltransferase family 2 protein n=1 Tax=Promicromonospora sp. NPDC023805 TaxID=3154696 RepID=UPI0034108515
MKLLSVVVPIYDVEHYLDACLASLHRQTYPEVEVVLVDDGSTDASSAIAERWASECGWKLVVQENLGLSAARNAGVDHASGDLLAFCDADDVVVETAYEMLCASLEQSGSDVASGAVMRLDSNGTREHPRYSDLFRATRLRTHIRQDHSIVLDRMIWNKVFVRRFWDANGLAFSLPQYEDAPVTIKAHLAARSVDVIDDVVYLWRIREAGQRSITQKLYEPKNILARMHMVLGTWDLLAPESPELRDAYLRDMCAGDVRIACEALVATGDPVMPAIDVARDFLLAAGDAAISRLEPDLRARAEAVLAIDVGRLIASVG